MTKLTASLNTLGLCLLTILYYVQANGGSVNQMTGWEGGAYAVRCDARARYSCCGRLADDRPMSRLRVIVSSDSSLILTSQFRVWSIILMLLSLQMSNMSDLSYLHNLITVQPPRSTRSSSLVTLARPSTSSSLRITHLSFQHASPRLWNQLPASLRQPRNNLSSSHSPSPLSGTSSVGSIDSPLSSSIDPSLFYSRLITYPLCKSFPSYSSFSSSGWLRGFPRAHVKTAPGVV